MNSDLITQRNKYDKTGECIQSGLGAEQIFDQIAESKNLSIKNAKRRENMHKHIDKHVTREDGSTWSVDIKARKKRLAEAILAHKTIGFGLSSKT